MEPSDRGIKRSSNCQAQQSRDRVTKRSSVRPPRNHSTRFATKVKSFSRIVYTTQLARTHFSKWCTLRDQSQAIFKKRVHNPTGTDPFFKIVYTSRPKSSLRLLCETAEVAKREGAEAFYAVFLRLNNLMNISKTNKSTIVPTQSMVNQQSPRASWQPAGGAIIDCSSGVVSSPRNRKGEEVSLFLNDRAIEQSIARSIERSSD